MSNRPCSARARSITCPPDGVFLKALCNRFITADMRSCGSAPQPFIQLDFFLTARRYIIVFSPRYRLLTTHASKSICT